MPSALRDSPERTPSAGVSLFVVDDVVLSGSARRVFGLLCIVVLVALGLFAAFWIGLFDRSNHPVLYLLASVVLAYLIVVWLAPWLATGRMRRPIHIAPERGLRVAAVTTFAPHAESAELLEQTLTALVGMRYPHETWVLDEGDDPAVRALCLRLGARHFSRHGRPEYQTAGGRFAAGSKHGNYNAWLVEAGFDGYDVVAVFDTDHIPEAEYLERTLGYFCDPDVGYVQPPQFYYNQEASFIARGAAEESYTYYSSLQMAGYAMGEPTVTGSHSVHRVAALRALGGFPAHDAEDLYLTMLYRGRGWRGIYVPEILALGITPVDWRGYLTQQRRWARALIDLKLRVYPTLVGDMPPVERLIGLLHGAYYLRPLVILIAYPMLVYMLVANVQPSFLNGKTLLAISGLTLVFMLADRFRQRYYLDPSREGGVHVRAMLLQFAKWPFFVRALTDALRGGIGVYDVTSKTGRVATRGALAGPHLILAAVVVAASAREIVRHGVAASGLLAVAGAYVALSIGLACSELVRHPPPFEVERHARRRAQIADRLAAYR